MLRHKQNIFHAACAVVSFSIACVDDEGVDGGSTEAESEGAEPDEDEDEDEELDRLAGPRQPPQEALAEAADLCAHAAQNAEFPPSAMVTAVALALAESGCNPGAAHDNGATPGCINGSRDRGLWQINDCYHPTVSDACAYDAFCNAKAALDISAGGTDWKPWSTFKNGLYLKWLETAQAAVDRLVPPVPPTPPPPEPPLRRASQSSDRDYNGDGRADVFWYQPGEGADPLWLGAANKSFVKTYAPNVQSLYSTVAGDFDGDDRADILFYAPGDLPDALWNGTASGSFLKSSPKDADGQVVNIKGEYVPIAGDFNGDGLDDVFWFAAGDGADSIWYGSGYNEFVHVATSVNGNYLPVAGDFDGDGRSDILWYGGGDAPEAVWYGRPSMIVPFDKSTTTDVDGLYLPFAGDFDGDGRSDVFWYAPGSTADHLWKGRSDRSFDHGFPIKPDGSAWNVEGAFQALAGDFNGDLRFDILWYGLGDDPDHIWYATSNGRFDSTPLSVTGTYAPI